MTKHATVALILFALAFVAPMALSDDDAGAKMAAVAAAVVKADADAQAALDKTNAEITKEVAVALEKAKNDRMEARKKSVEKLNLKKAAVLKAGNLDRALEAKKQIEVLTQEMEAIKNNGALVVIANEDRAISLRVEDAAILSEYRKTKKTCEKRRFDGLVMRISARKKAMSDLEGLKKSFMKSENLDAALAAKAKADELSKEIESISKALPGAFESKSLTELTPVSSSVGYGSLVVGDLSKPNDGFGGVVLNLDKGKSSLGIFAHAKSSVLYEVGDAGFDCVSGYACMANDTGPEEAKFSILGDGVLLWSGVVKTGSKTRFNVKIGNSEKLELKVVGAQHGYTHSFWLDPVLEKGQKKSTSAPSKEESHGLAPHQEYVRPAEKSNGRTIPMIILNP